MNKENTLKVAFRMDAQDYKTWKNGAVGEKFENAHPITEKSFNSVLAVAGKFTTFQHLKRTDTEVEITFYEKDLLNLVYFATDIMDQA